MEVPPAPVLRIGPPVLPEVRDGLTEAPADDVVARFHRRRPDVVEPRARPLRQEARRHAERDVGEHDPVVEEVVPHFVGERVAHEVDEKFLVDRRRHVVRAEPVVPVAEVFEHPLSPVKRADAVAEGLDDVRNDLPRVVRVAVELQPLEVLHGKAVPLPGEHLVEPLDARGGLPEVGDVIGVRVVDDLVVRRGDEALGGIEPVREPLERDEALPLGGRVPARQGEERIPSGAHGETDAAPVPDVSPDVGIDEILSREGELADARGEFPPVTGPVDARERRELVVDLAAGPAHAGDVRGPSLLERRLDVGDDGAVPGEPHRERARRVPPDRDLLRQEHQGIPLARVEVMRARQGIELLGVEVRVVGHDVGDPPGEGVVPPRDDRRDSRHGHSPHAQTGHLHLELVPARGGFKLQVGVVGEYRRARH